MYRDAYNLKVATPRIERFKFEEFEDFVQISYNESLRILQQEGLYLFLKEMVHLVNLQNAFLSKSLDFVLIYLE